MSIHRNDFLESFARNTSSLDLVCLNHSGAPTGLLTDISTITLLADKKSSENFINYCKSHPLVTNIAISPQYRRSQVLVSFLDGSELSFLLLRQMIRKTLVCLEPDSIRKNAIVNEFGMLVASHEHHFDFMILNSQFNKIQLADRYRNYFSGVEFKTRATIFKYIQTRYNMVFNTLEDLYEPKANLLLTIMIGLRSEKKNTLFRMFIRSIEFGIFNLFSVFTKKEIRISASALHVPEIPSAATKRMAGHRVL